MKVEICSTRTKDVICTLDVSASSTIEKVKQAFENLKPKYYVSRQSMRADPRGKSLSNDETLRSLGFENFARLYFKDLGPQVRWKTVFLAEYMGPLFLYALFFVRPGFIYGADAASRVMHWYVQVAFACYMFHYSKRVLETQFVHRFSNATMPIGNLFKNCTYYWTFTCLVAYFVNHPLYTPASFGDVQFYGALAVFVLCELGNFSTHVLFRNLRPPGSKLRLIPMPTSNPFTWLFRLVSCPNYTYEVGAWIGFTVMTQTLTAGVFTLCGFVQMLLWAIKKHKNYKREFKDYPRNRKAMVPFII